MMLTLVGSAIGTGAAYAVTRVLQRLLFGVSATDLTTFVVIPMLLLGVALVACWVPARRTTRMTPMAALRHD
jgi:ABC-type antimicrobial peptide transport system permease subunit